MTAAAKQKRQRVQRVSDWDDARFANMSARIADDLRLTAVHFRLLAYLGRVNTSYGWCELSQKGVAERWNLSRQSVNQAVGELVGWGYVEKRGQDKTRLSVCHYRVVIDPPAVPVDALGVSGLDDTPPGEGVSSPDDTRVSPRGDTRVMPEATHVSPLTTPREVEQRSKIKDHSPLPPRKRGAGGCGNPVDELLTAVAAPERERAIRLLIAPVIRQRRFEAPDRVFALTILADWASKHGDLVLGEAAASVLETRKATVKPADIEDALKAAIANAKTQAKVLAAAGGFGPAVQVDTEVAGRAEDLRRELVHRLGREVVAAWFAAATPAAIGGGVLTLAVPVKFSKTWIENHYGRPLEEAARAVFGVERVQVIVATVEQAGRAA